MLGKVSSVFWKALCYKALSQVHRHVGLLAGGQLIALCLKFSRNGETSTCALYKNRNSYKMDFNYFLLQKRLSFPTVAHCEGPKYQKESGGLVENVVQ